MSEKRSEKEIIAEAYSDEAAKTWRAPVQGYPAGIPWPLQLEAYETYSKRWSPQTAMIDLKGRHCRGGFSTGELDEFVPGWRERISYIGRLEARIAELEAAKDSPAAQTNVRGIHPDQTSPMTVGPEEFLRDEHGNDLEPFSGAIGIGGASPNGLSLLAAWQELCETPDITSPEEYPDHALITMEQLGSFMARAVGNWHPILEADKGIDQIITAGDTRIGNSLPIWARDSDGRIFECLWADDGKRAYWWDIEGESPVDPVEYMPHPLAALSAREGSE